MRFSVAFMCVVGCFSSSLPKLWWDGFVRTLKVWHWEFRMKMCHRTAMHICDCFAGSLRGAGDTKSPMIAAMLDRFVCGL